MTRVALPGAGDCGGRRFSAVPPQTVDLPDDGTGRGPAVRREVRDVAKTSDLCTLR